MLTNKQLDYFNNLAPGTTVKMSQAKDPDAFKKAAMEYMDSGNYSIVFSEDFSTIRKCTPCPTEKKIVVIFE